MTAFDIIRARFRRAETRAGTGSDNSNPPLSRVARERDRAKPRDVETIMSAIRNDAKAVRIQGGRGAQAAFFARNEADLVGLCRRLPLEHGGVKLQARLRELLKQGKALARGEGAGDYAHRTSETLWDMMTDLRRAHEREVFGQAPRRPVRRPGAQARAGAPQPSF